MKVQSKLAIFVSSTTIIFYTILIFVLVSNAVIAATKTANRQNTVNYISYPYNMFDIRYHNIGLLYLPITNFGMYGLEINLGTIVFPGLNIK